MTINARTSYSLICALPMLLVNPANAQTKSLPELKDLHPLKGEWIDAQMDLAAVLKADHASRVRQIIELSELQLSEENLWIIGGAKGKGPMPQEYYRERITSYLAEPDWIASLRREFSAGDVIYHFLSPEGKEGYVLVRERKAVRVFWLAIP